MVRGLFEYIRKTSFTRFILAWVISLFAFALLYEIFSFSGMSITIKDFVIPSNASGIIDNIYASFLVGTLIGSSIVSSIGVLYVIIILQQIFSVLILLVLLDKIIQKYVTPDHGHVNLQDKKIMSTLLTLSIFRTEVDKIIHEIKLHKRKTVEIKEIEAVIDGLYVAFLDVEKLFSITNIHRNRIKGMHYVMITENIEDCLAKLEKFLEIMTKNNISWRDKSTEFWIKYIVETAQRIAENSDKTHISNPKIVIAIENMREYAVKIRERLEQI